MYTKINDFLKDYILEKSEDKSKNTISYYITDLKQFDKFINNKDIVAIKNADVLNFKKNLSELNLKPKTVNRKLLSIKQFMEWINSNEEIDIKVFLKIKLYKIQEQEYLEELLEMTDFERLSRMAQRENDLRALAIFNTLYLTGVRVSEMLQFKVQDINKDFVNVIGKGEKSRDVPIPDKLKDYLKDYVRERNQSISGHLFVNKNNDNSMSRQSIDRIIKNYAGMAKVKLSKAHAHNFRHLSGIRMIEEGLSIDEVADILGHGNINTTRIYTRKTKKELLKAINRL
jgi:integrase/recombinase XerD